MRRKHFYWIQVALLRQELTTSDLLREFIFFFLEMSRALSSNDPRFSNFLLFTSYKQQRLSRFRLQNLFVGACLFIVTSQSARKATVSELSWMVAMSHAIGGDKVYLWQNSETHSKYSCHGSGHLCPYLWIQVKPRFWVNDDFATADLF